MNEKIVIRRRGGVVGTGVRSRRVMIAAAAMAAGAALAACGSSGSTSTSSTGAATAASGGSTITIKNFGFQPDHLTVHPGQMVTVVNEDSVDHTVTAKAGSGATFDTGDLSQGQKTTITAPTKPGTYPYFCRIHNFMQGTITVSG